MEIILNDLPKISNNKFYAGCHWTERKRIKDLYKLSIMCQTHIVFGKHDVYECEYIFEFGTSPLDASNCVGMLKMIEDCLFEDDKHDIVKSIKISSIKSDKDRVTIKIK